MASTGKKIATGCGIGCLLVVIVLGGLGTCTYLSVKNMKSGVEEIDTSFEALGEHFGDAADHVPAAGGGISPDRLQTFMAVRNDLLTRGAESIETVATLDGDAGALDKIRAGMRLVGSMVTFVEVRNAALVDHGMSPGEYLYLYATVYYAMLAHDPGDGPGFDLSSEHRADVNVHWSSSDERHSRGDRDRKVRRDLNRLLSAMLENQRAALEAGSDIDPHWALQLAAECVLLADDPTRLPWQDGLPDRIRTSLAPYRDDLEALYDPYLNALETAIVDRP